MGPWPGQNQQPPSQVMRVEGVITPSVRPAMATTILKTEQGWKARSTAAPGLTMPSTRPV